LEKTKQLKALIAAAKLDDGSNLQTGTHCNYCSKAYGCPKLKEEVMTVSEVKIETLDGKSLCQTLDAVIEQAELVSILKTSLEAAITERVNKGEQGLSYHLVPGRSSLNWTDENIVAKLRKLESVLKVVLVRDNPVTPTQALALKVPQPVIDKLSKKQPGKLQLKKIDFNKLFGE
jgi:hypothetical protein